MREVAVLEDGDREEMLPVDFLHGGTHQHVPREAVFLQQFSCICSALSTCLPHGVLYLGALHHSNLLLHCQPIPCLFYYLLAPSQTKHRSCFQQVITF